MSTFDVSNIPETQTGTVNLTVQTGDEAAEIFIIDSQFHRVARGVGEEVEFPLPRGLYTVKVRTGVECREKLIILSKDDHIPFDPIEFASPAPLEGTAKTHEFHASNADTYSHSVNETRGQGSQIYVFARDWTAPGPSPLSLTSLHPARGLTLRDRHGEVLVDFAGPSWPQNLEGEPWAACNTEVDPGTYRLSLKLASNDVLEQTIVASSGWQTQIFLLQREYGFKESDRRADLSNASIFMSRLGSGFHPQKLSYEAPDQVDFRLTEMARQGLINERQVLTDEVVRRMLDEKFSNPMLGIYGAHLLLLREEPDRETLRLVLANLRKLLGGSHPDVEALALKLGQGSDYIFDFPPMLRRSWAYVLKASVRQLNLVPEGSLAYQASDRLWSGNPWLLWRQSSEHTDSEGASRQLRRLIRQASGDLENSEDGLQQIPNSLAQQNAKAVDSGIYQAFQQLDDKEMIELVQTLGVPRNKLEAWIKSLN
jgi:hypothetical protein